LEGWIFTGRVFSDYYMVGYTRPPLNHYLGFAEDLGQDSRVQKYPLGDRTQEVVSELFSSEPGDSPILQEV